MSTSQPVPEAAPQIALPWIVRLRYGMALGQVATALFVRYALGVDIPLGALAIAPALVGASNLLLATRIAHPDISHKVATSTLVAWAFVLDTVSLTFLLMLSGGPTNPFSLLYLVHITLSAIILTKRWTWVLGALSTLCFGLLFRIYRPIPELEMHHPADGTSLHLTGMWIGFGVAAFLVALFSGKISELLRQHEDSLLRMQIELAKRDRLASLGTLAAGAAHEAVETIPADKIGVDIGPQTIEKFSQVIASAKTVIWNGPMGIFEKPPLTRVPWRWRRRWRLPARFRWLAAAIPRRPSKPPASPARSRTSPPVAAHRSSFWPASNSPA